jgi:hypothetical protein
MILETIQREGRRILICECDECHKRFDRDGHGASCLARAQTKVYCCRRCAQTANVRAFRASGQAAGSGSRFSQFKERVI